MPKATSGPARCRARGQDLPRRLVGVQVPGGPRPGDDGLRQRRQQVPRLRERARHGRRRDPGPVPGQARHQGILAAPGHEPLRGQHREEAIGEGALADRLRRPRRRHRPRPPGTGRPAGTGCGSARAAGPRPASPAAPRHGPRAGRTPGRSPGSSTRRPRSPRSPRPSAGGRSHAARPWPPAPASPALAVPGLPALAATTRRRRLRPRPLRRPAERHRCRTARSARARSSSASRAASSATRRLSCSFASSAAASTSRSGASPASPSAATPAATVTTTANTLSSTETPATPNLSRNRNPGTRPRPITVPGHVWRHQIRAPGRPVARFGQGSCHSPRVARTASFGPAALGLRAGL